jgi:uncharacterized membrane protein YphA (DoxX/SURF4 family)
VYSGFDKILSFDKKVCGLKKKINLPIPILNLAMFLVILLEIFAPLIIIRRLYCGKSSSRFLKYISNMMFKLLLLFLLVVTFLYHPPTDKMIPFLSNCTTFSGVIFLFILSNSDIVNGQSPNSVD